MGSRGYTLLEILLSVAILGVVVMTAMKLMEYQSRIQSTLDFQAEMRDLSNEITDNLNDRDRCTHFIGGESSNGDPVNMDFPGRTLVPGDSNDGHYGKKVFVEEAYIADQTNIAGNEFFANLIVIVDWPDSVLGAPVIKRFPLYYTDSTGTTIDDCAGVASASSEALCEQLRGQWTGSNCDFSRMMCQEVGGYWNGTTCDMRQRMCNSSGGAYIEGPPPFCDFCPAMGLGTFDMAAGHCSGAGNPGNCYPPGPTGLTWSFRRYCTGNLGSCALGLDWGPPGFACITTCSNDCPWPQFVRNFPPNCCNGGTAAAFENNNGPNPDPIPPQMLMQCGPPGNQNQYEWHCP